MHSRLHHVDGLHELRTIVVGQRQRPFDQGVVEAILAGYGLLGKAAPPFVALPTLPVSREQVLGVWDQIYRLPAPTDIVRAAGSGALTTIGDTTTPG